MEQFVIDQVKSGLRYLPVNLVKSAFIPKSNAQTKKLRKNFICGVCHPHGFYDDIKNANMDWVRTDIPFPFNKDGSLNESYTEYKAECKKAAEHGIKVMAVTPYPRDYISYGADIREPGGSAEVSKIAEFLIEDLQGVVGGIQVTNEMGMPHFTLPLDITQAAEFIGTQLRAMYPKRGDILIGYNSAGPQADLHSKMQPYFRYCDYIGIDIYIGCFAGVGGFMWMFDALVGYLWAFTGKPILIQEFGYMSGGKPKTAEEKKDILFRYGAESETEAKEDIEYFVEMLPKTLKEHTKHVCEGDSSRYFDFLFKSDITNHLYCELPSATKIPGFDHTPEGQAKFYETILPRLYKKEYVCGTIIYCYNDSEHCYICGQSDCPIETRWGLATCDGEPKPSYYAVKKAFGKIKLNK